MYPISQARVPLRQGGELGFADYADTGHTSCQRLLHFGFDINAVSTESLQLLHTTA